MGKINERGAGRKPVFTNEIIQEIKYRRAQGEAVSLLAEDYGVSRQTISKYLNQQNETTEMICNSLKKWREMNRKFHAVNTTDYLLRLDFMCEEECCTMILADYKREKIEVINTTEDIIHRAFGIKAKPTWQDFEMFLEERCFPRSRDQLRLVLKDIGVDFYDPLAIVEKTKGRMAEDLQWVKITYLNPKAK